MRNQIQLIFWTVFLLALAGVSDAAVLPVEIPLTFQLTNVTDGNNLNGTHQTVFRFYTAVTGGTATFFQSTPVSYSNGVGHVVIDNTSAVADWSVQYRLTIEVAVGSETSPRINITPTPQALYAENATFAINSTNSSYALLAGSITGNITTAQITDLASLTRTSITTTLII